MRSRAIYFAILLAQSVVVTELSAADTTSRLAHVDMFAVGGVGYAGQMSEGEAALREALAASDAVTRLEALLPRASRAGQLYILLGLHIRDRAAYARALPRCRHGAGLVHTMRGCIGLRESFADVIREIDSGTLDAFVTRPWNH
jgi:hypothetical protein